MPGRRADRRGGIATVLLVWAGAGLLVALPARPAELGLSVEAGLALALVALWRNRPGAAAARASIAILLLLLAALRLAELTARVTLGRAFNPWLDPLLAPDLYRVLAASVGTAPSVLLLLAGLAALALAFRLLQGGLNQAAVAFERRPARRGFAIVAAAVCGLYLAQGLAPAAFGGWRPVTDGAARIAARQAAVVATTLERHGAFAAALAADEAATDDQGDASGAPLAGLGGADVLLIFVESYGAAALDDPGHAAAVVPALRRFEQRLADAGLSAASGRLVSPTVGGQSWLAHATLLSGLWIEDQTLYGLLLASGRRTLVDDFAAAGYRTAAIMPAITAPWPEGRRYRFDAIHAAGGMGYRGPTWYWGTVPDQYALSFLERRERAPRLRPPLFATVALIGSHAPWTPVPGLVEDWAAIGDGEVFARWAENGEPAAAVWRDPAKIRAYYARSVAASLDVVADWTARFAGPRTLVLILGDHQPAPVAAGPDASRAVPVHIIAGDPALLAPFRRAGFAPGLLTPAGAVLPDAALPGAVPPDATPLRMDAVRRLLLDGFAPPRGTLAEHDAVAPADRPPG